MSDYYPDRWVGVKINPKVGAPVYKIFACWYGGYAGSDSWKLNSGITKATLIEEGYAYSFEGSSGSVYNCSKDCYGTNMYGGGVLQNIIDNAAKKGISIEILAEDTNFMEISYDF